MGLALALEEFDDVPAPAIGGASAAPSPDWQDGHAAGRAEALAEAATAQGALALGFVETLEDMAFGYAEARGVLMSELVGFFDRLAETLLPSLGPEVLTAHLAQALAQAAHADLAQPLVLRVAVADVVGVSDRLAARPDLPFTCRADPGLAPGSATLSGGGRETSLDAARLVSDLRAILSAFIDDQRQEATHG